jgi:hypothetical protein
MGSHKGFIIDKYAKMWPRQVFDIRDGKKYLPEIKQLLSEPGIYVLYREDEPYYVGKASTKMFRRLRAHAVSPKDRYYNFWNYFSAFVVKDTRHLSDVEGILIAAMPTYNSAFPRFKKIYIPVKIADSIRGLRNVQFNSRKKKKNK